MDLSGRPRRGHDRTYSAANQPLRCLSAAGIAFPTTSGTGSVHDAAGRHPLQLDELQPQRLDPGDEAVQRRAVGHPTDQDGVVRGLPRCERIEHLQHSWRQPAGYSETVISTHVILTSDRSARTGAGAHEAMVGAAG
ncbi:MAG: hypothetical protein QOJ68_1265 [Blastococcus sp.]|jgi:hypothetical protein|nr:hypothetical protein [Blastococcus sp.]